MSGKADSWFMAFAAFGSQQILAWLNVWIGLLDGTELAHPHWRRSANNEALIVSTVLVVVIFALLRRRSERMLRLSIFTAFGLSVISLGLCALAKHFTNQQATAGEIEEWKGYWHIIYVAATVTLLGAFSVCAMFVAKHKSI